MNSSLLKKSGLAEEDIKQIIGCIREFPDIKQAKLFGSRAKGNYKAGSDIDIALYVEGDNVENILFLLQDKLEESNCLPYFFDLVNFDAIENNQLKEHIQRVGITLYCA